MVLLAMLFPSSAYLSSMVLLASKAVLGFRSSTVLDDSQALDFWLLATMTYSIINTIVAKLQMQWSLVP